MIKNVRSTTFFLLAYKKRSNRFLATDTKKYRKMWYSFSKKSIKKAVADVCYAVFASEHNLSSTTEEY